MVSTKPIALLQNQLQPIHLSSLLPKPYRVDIFLNLTKSFNFEKTGAETVLLTFIGKSKKQSRAELHEKKGNLCLCTQIK